MRKRSFVLISLAFAGCSAPVSSGNTKDSTVVIPADTVSQLRTHINSTPAAIYSEKIPDELNDWKFEVSLYETSKTFQYLLRVRYKELRIADSLQVPDLGILPEVAIHKGKDPLSCIIGFLDKKDEFKEYKLVRIKNDQLKITTINNYRIARYKTVVK